MPDSTSWDVIFGADSDQVILGVSFPAAGRREEDFAELATRIGPGYKFLQTKPPMVRCGQQPCGDAYVGPWIESIKRDRHQVLAVLGYRTGSVYAAAIAEGISRWQPMPKVILFDPQFTSTRLLGLEFHREISSISSLLSDDEIERTRKIVTELPESAADGVTDTAAEMAELYWEVSSVAFERVGLGDAYNGRFITPFVSYISWMSGADQIDPTAVWKRSTAIVSSDYERRPNGTPLAAGADRLIGRSIPVDVGHSDLLRSEPVAAAVLGLLGSR